ncbi:hypothetical protein [Rubrivirga sp.]|uniref:hypothetical protein n=1 Tax=Rubrivirga sp. TaxID=1885344 RepID=UPI003B526873
MRRRLLPYVPPILLAVIAVAQFAVAKTTPLTAWKLGGFGMFSTSNHPVSRVLRVAVETDEGVFVVPDAPGPTNTLTWPRRPALRQVAREAACGRWRFVPLDSLETAIFPSPSWAPFYRSPPAREQTEFAGFAVPADPASEDPGAGVRSARASVVWIRLDTGGDRSVLRPAPVAAETVTPAEAGCPPVP